MHFKLSTRLPVQIRVFSAKVQSTSLAILTTRQQQQASRAVSASYTHDLHVRNEEDGTRRRIDIAQSTRMTRSCLKYDHERKQHFHSEGHCAPFKSACSDSFLSSRRTPSTMEARRSANPVESSRNSSSECLPFPADDLCEHTAASQLRSAQRLQTHLRCQPRKDDASMTITTAVRANQHPPRPQHRQPWNATLPSQRRVRRSPSSKP